VFLILFVFASAPRSGSGSGRTLAPEYGFRQLFRAFLYVSV
jgi:hypothetical protein